jgi:carbamoyl-phosphate synthase large subunit
MTADVTVLLTCTGRRYDIVSAFAAHCRVVSADASPLAPAQYAAQVQARVPRVDDPRYVPTLADLCAEHDVTAVVPLSDLDIEILARAREEAGLPAFVPPPSVAEATYDKYLTHRLLTDAGLPSPPTVLPGEEPDRYPVMIKPRRGSASRSIFRCDTPDEVEFFVRYVREPVMVQRALDGAEFSMDCLSDLDGTCLNAIARTMLGSNGGEAVKGTTIADPELVDLARAVVETLGIRGPCTVQCFRDPELGLRVTDVNARFGGGFPAPWYAAPTGRTYPELIVRMAAGERVEPHVGEYRPGVTFTRYPWHLELDEQLRPTGR